ncbi:unnamed protein product [Cuscuta campestris]|uniref:Uncharacterized protein n=1 Tax=Cuscuta campestris TaxID=132261 RepID=A0A484LL53_9ASTE|nr:unnamed protein product [Cuscuta campestris]
MLGAIKILIDTPPSAPNLVSTVVEKHTEAHGQASKEESNIDSQVGDEVDIGPETINRDDGRSNVVETNEGPLAANVAHVDKPDSTFHEFYTSVGWVISKYDVPKSVDKVVDADGKKACSPILIHTIKLFELIDVVKYEHLGSKKIVQCKSGHLSYFYRYTSSEKLLEEWSTNECLFWFVAYSRIQKHEWDPPP